MTSKESNTNVPTFTKCDMNLPTESCEYSNLGYDEALLASHPAASSAAQTPTPAKKAKQAKAPKESPLSIFQRSWVEMRINCADPKTSLNLVKTMKAEVLSALINSNLLSIEITDKLELQWDLLGPDQITIFLNLFLTKREDRDAIINGGAGFFLDGMIAATQTHTKIQLLEAAESMALIKTDMDLTTKSLAATKLALSDSEDTWRGQSSLISKYTCQLEGMLKTAVSDLENYKLKASQEVPTTTLQTSQTTHGRMTYVKTKEKVTIYTLPDTPPDETVAARQIQHFLDRMINPEDLMPFDPNFLMEEFRTTYKAQKVTAVKAFNMVLSNLGVKTLIPERK
ncbi:hypothetical protein JYU34_010528 [Plutella xylostella]|uniref:Gag protein n=1 Tax=Plutella xylostella TaxID=51655 RepID=A0ABQ7QIJ6_PLUXY|nr:hypothetical protein JYU34_010528 [Plutella xylostella]